MRWQGLMASVMAVACTGCATKFVSRPLSTTKYDTEGIEGVIYYQPRLVCLTWKFTAFVKDGVLEEKNPPCTPIVQTQELRVMADLSRPIALIHKPSKFASGTLAVTISDGLLTSLNSENTPLTAELLGKVAEIGTAAAGVVKASVATSGEKTAACNAAPQISKIEDVSVSKACSSP